MRQLKPRAKGYEKGLAAGAGIDVGEVLLHRYCEEIYLDIARGYGLTVAQCSEYWFPETPNGPLLGKGWDDAMAWYRETPLALPAADQGRGALFEKSRYNYAVRMSGRNVLITTYGGCEDEDMRALCNTSSALFTYYERRLQVMKEIVAEAGEGLDLNVYWRSILHHDEEAPSCTHLQARPEGIELFTFGAFAYLPREGRSLARTLARVDGGLRYGCEMPAVESRWRFI